MKVSGSKRVREIAELLQKQEYVSSGELAEKYQVSMETIRKDLLFLEEKGIAKKEYGGASLAMAEIEKNLEFRRDGYGQKEEIARFAAGLLAEHHSVILDAGSTCIACCKYINLLPSLDIFTNSIDALLQLDGAVHNVFFAGGKKREKNRAVVGEWTERYFRSVQAEVCILGTSGLLDAEGATSHSYQEIGAKKAMVERSGLVYIVADSRKFQERGLHTVASWKQIDGIITDHFISPKLLEQYEKKVPVFVAGED